MIKVPVPELVEIKKIKVDEKNPRGMMRKQVFMENLPRKTINYCQYGLFAQKPTDVWTNCVDWIPKKRCKPGDKCHASAKRGDNQGIQSLCFDNFERSKIPADLCKEIVLVCNGKLRVVQKIL